ncbi:hypothetical protein KIW84_043245 [Lathyrus oleraceus]|uniref:DUF4283 domain-containing protein n=1 Tax=Pisum sativum TaxID=3888 RepID=A0A9D4XEV2_PEA|nr:hypothetical protein KIW84_043245 [Pisum sativum]
MGGRIRDLKNSTFNIKEFGERNKATYLYHDFEDLGDIGEVIIPPKRNVRGKRYEFVIFFNVKDVRVLATKLDDILLNDRKIFANIPRFHRKYLDLKKKKDVVGRGRLEDERKGFLKSGKEVGRRFFHNGRNLFRANKMAYAEAIKGQSYTMQEMFYSKGYFLVKATSMGTNLCLLEELVEGELATLVEDIKVWLGKWFKDVRKWKREDVDPERVTWIRCYGFPCQVWNVSVGILARKSVIEDDESEYSDSESESSHGGPIIDVKEEDFNAITIGKGVRIMVDDVTCHLDLGAKNVEAIDRDEANQFSHFVHLLVSPNKKVYSDNIICNEALNDEIQAQEEESERVKELGGLGLINPSYFACLNSKKVVTLNSLVNMMEILREEDNCFSGGSILCCESLIDSDVICCNNCLLKNIGYEVSRVVWDSITNLGISCKAKQEDYVKAIEKMEMRDKEGISTMEEKMKRLS